MSFVEKLIRGNIKALKPYSTARDDFYGQAEVYLDANENPYPQPFNRYPDPYQRKLKELLADRYGIKSSQLLLGNGSDEVIDLLIRAFCEPKVDSILVTPPTYGMYSVCAAVNAVDVKEVLLQEDFNLDTEQILRSVSRLKIIFLCSPNNPTGNLLDPLEIEKILKRFTGLVVLDEAYIDFASQPSFINRLSLFPNLVVIQTLSKAWGLAGLRLGICFASEEIIRVLNKIKYPYNVNSYTQEKAFELLAQDSLKTKWVKEIVEQREILTSELKTIPFIENVYHSDSNFLLVKMKEADRVYQYLLSKGVIVRNRTHAARCKNCLRITVGTREENRLLISLLKSL